MGLFEMARQCLLAADPDEKMNLSEETAALWREGNLSFDADAEVLECV